MAPGHAPPGQGGGRSARTFPRRERALLGCSEAAPAESINIPLIRQLLDSRRGWRARELCNVPSRRRGEMRCDAPPAGTPLPAPGAAAAALPRVPPARRRSPLPSPPLPPPRRGPRRGARGGRRASAGAPRARRSGAERGPDPAGSARPPGRHHSAPSPRRSAPAPPARPAPPHTQSPSTR
ncbi:nematocyst expressed protein 3-like [Manacus candei]|uniref:nematocyst expressed protein 3-like n=1 Tax=Manacus candei TaxID=415023 RepID=UPI002225DDDF|nr:nematocyst expressed protein 3-like [Manacus candei]